MGALNCFELNLPLIAIRIDHHQCYCWVIAAVSVDLHINIRTAAVILWKNIVSSIA